VSWPLRPSAPACVLAPISVFTGAPVPPRPCPCVPLPAGAPVPLPLCACVLVLVPLRLVSQHLGLVLCASAPCAPAPPALTTALLPCSPSAPPVLALLLLVPLCPGSSPPAPPIVPCSSPLLRLRPCAPVPSLLHACACLLSWVLLTLTCAPAPCALSHWFLCAPPALGHLSRWGTCAPAPMHTPAHLLGPWRSCASHPCRLTFVSAPQRLFNLTSSLCPLAWFPAHAPLRLFVFRHWGTCPTLGRWGTCAPAPIHIPQHPVHFALHWFPNTCTPAPAHPLPLCPSAHLQALGPLLLRPHPYTYTRREALHGGGRPYLSRPPSRKLSSILCRQVLKPSRNRSPQSLVVHYLRDNLCD